MALELTGPAAVLRALQRAPGPVLLTGPVNPDGDSLGACLGLARVLAARGVDAVVAGVPSHRYRWMPGAADMVPDAELSEAWGAVLVADGDRHRLTPQAERAFAQAPIRAIVDHHGSTDPGDGYTHAWVDPAAASTCAMIYGALPGWNHALESELAQLLYAGTLFDTGGFRHPNTTPYIHRMAAHLLEFGFPHHEICSRILHERRLAGLRLAGEVYRSATLWLAGRVLGAPVPQDLQRRVGMAEGDCDGLVESLTQVDGVEVGFLAIERGDAVVKVSLRSRSSVDVAAAAHELAPTGGGHARAAGAVLRATVDEAVARVVAVLGRRLT